MENFGVVFGQMKVSAPLSDRMHMQRLQQDQQRLLKQNRLVWDVHRTISNTSLSLVLSPHYGMFLNLLILELFFFFFPPEDNKNIAKFNKSSF